MKHLFVKAALTLLLSVPGLAMAADATDRLKQEMDALKRQNRLILERLDATMDQVENTKGLAGSGSTRIGGYGELHFNQLDNNKIGGSDKNEIDLHRFILFVGHDFNKDIRLWSELEVEHTKVDDKGGEVAIEQAYVEFDLTENLLARAGVMLLPVGIMNETHEPPTFYGVERNNVEKYIIPTTWREGGVSLNGHNGSFSYDLAIHSGCKRPPWIIMQCVPDEKLCARRLPIVWLTLRVSSGQALPVLNLRQACNSKPILPRKQIAVLVRQPCWKHISPGRRVRLHCAPCMPVGAWMVLVRLQSALMNRPAGMWNLHSKSRRSWVFLPATVVGIIR